VRERSLVENVAIDAGGAPVGLFVALNGCAITLVAAITAANPAISKDVSGRVLRACIDLLSYTAM